MLIPFSEASELTVVWSKDDRVKWVLGNLYGDLVAQCEINCNPGCYYRIPEYMLHLRNLTITDVLGKEQGVNSKDVALKRIGDWRVSAEGHAEFDVASGNRVESKFGKLVLTAPAGWDHDYPTRPSDAAKQLIKLRQLGYRLHVYVDPKNRIVDDLMFDRYETLGAAVEYLLNERKPRTIAIRVESMDLTELEQQWLESLWIDDSRDNEDFHIVKALVPFRDSNLIATDYPEYLEHLEALC